MSLMGALVSLLILTHIGLFQICAVACISVYLSHVARKSIFGVGNQEAVHLQPCRFSYRGNYESSKSDISENKDSVLNGGADLSDLCPRYLHKEDRGRVETDPLHSFCCCNVAVRRSNNACIIVCADNTCKRPGENHTLTKCRSTLYTIFKSEAFGQCPMVVDGDLELFQSNAILRYLGRKHGLNADNIKDEAKIDMVMDHVEDVRMAYVKMIYGNYEDGKADYISNIPKKFQPFENLLKAWGNDYILSKITFADYNLFDLLDDHLVLAPDCLKGFPILQAYHARIAGRPKLKAYRDTEAFQKTPVNGNGKQ